MALANRKKILVFVDWYHPGYKAGGPIRSMYNLIHRLGASMDFYVITRSTDYLSDDPYPGIQENTWITLEPGHNVWYCSTEKTNAKDFIQAIGGLAFDAVYVNGMFSPVFSILPVRLFNSGKIPASRLIVAPRGMLAPDALQLKATKKKLFLRLTKWMRLYRHAEWHATSSEEAKQIAQRYPKASISTFTNVTDVSQLAAPRETNKKAGELRLISVARIAREKNLIYALSALKHVSQPVHLDIFGSVYDQPYLQECRQVAESLPPHISVSFHHAIPNTELPGLLPKYHALILPTLGENFGHIIAESLLAGVPVIISNRTPWNHLHHEGAGYVIPLENQTEWAAVINRLSAMDTAEYHQLLQNTHQFAVRMAEDSALIDAYLAWFSQNVASPLNHSQKASS
jgi:glycosyltransferase involved in cell wall biosynthesis